MAPTNTTQVVLRYLHENLFRLEEDEARLLSELNSIRERIAVAKDSLKEISTVSPAPRTHRSKYLLGKVPEEEITSLSDTDLDKHIRKVAVSQYNTRNQQQKEVLEIVTDNLCRLRQEKVRRKHLVK